MKKLSMKKKRKFIYNASTIDKNIALDQSQRCFDSTHLEVLASVNCFGQYGQDLAVFDYSNASFASFFSKSVQQIQRRNGTIMRNP